MLRRHSPNSTIKGGSSRKVWPIVAHCRLIWPFLAHSVERRINNLRPVLLILKGLFYIDTVEVADSSSAGPTTVVKHIQPTDLWIPSFWSPNGVQTPRLPTFPSAQRWTPVLPV